MNSKFLILLLSAFLALVLSDRTDGKTCTQTRPLCCDTETVDETSFESSDNRSEFGIPRQNSYSAPVRNLQPVKRTTSSGQTSKIFAVRTGKALDINIYLHTLACCQADYSGTYSPGRLLLSLRKLII